MKDIKELLETIAQEISYKTGDVIQSYPPPLTPIAVGVIRALMDALTAQMTEGEKKLAEMTRERSEIVVLPSSFDPRRKRE